MDERVGRLNQLQMADLGTARREQISTADYRRGLKTRIESLEACRESNVPGTEAQRAAEANKSVLANWANVYQKIGDTEDLENLDNLLNGQSHRAQLNSIIQQSGGQTYSKANPQNNKQIRVKIPPFQSSPAVSLGLANNGRSRVEKPSLRNLASRPPPAQGRLNPLLDNINKVLENGNPQKNASQGRTDKRKAAPLPTVKKRRPAGDFSRVLSPPESFLAVARSLVNTRGLGAAPPLGEHVSNDHRSVPSWASLKSTHGNVASIKEGTHTNEQQMNERPAYPVHPEQDPKTPTSKSKVFGTSKEEGSSNPSENENQTEKSAQKDDLVRDTCREPHENVVIEQVKENPKPDFENADKVLVDLSFTPPSKSLNGVGVLMSPAFEELKGLDFSKISKQDNPSLDNAYPTRKPGFEEPVEREKEVDPTKVVLITKVHPKNISVVDVYQRDIDLLCELMASTTLSDTYLTRLKECKEELEARLSLARNRSGQPSTISEHVQMGIVAQKPAVEESTQMILAQPSTPKIPLPSHSRVSSMEVDSPSPRTRLKATAPHFIPKGAFTEYRNPSNSTSSDSTIAQLAPSTPKTRTATEDTHIFGDHLLPGSKARTKSTLIESHIFGDHLLPGRGAKTSETKANEALSKPPSKPPSLSEKVNAPNTHPPVVQNVTQLGLTREVLGQQLTNRMSSSTAPVKPMQKKVTSKEIQQSIHAPKTEEPSNTASRFKRSFSNDLMSSRYAVPEFL